MKLYECTVCGGVTDLFIGTGDIRMGPCCMNESGRELVFRGSEYKDFSDWKEKMKLSGKDSWCSVCGGYTRGTMVLNKKCMCDDYSEVVEELDAYNRKRGRSGWTKKI